MKTRVIQDEPRLADQPVHGSPDGPPSGYGVVGPIRRHPLIAFFVLAYALSWFAVPAGEFMPFGPLLAVLIVIPLVEGRAGLRVLGSRMLRWRAGWRTYALAIALPLGAVVAAIGLSLLLGAPISALDELDPWYLLIGLFFLRLVNPLDGPMGEEPGWRGFALPRLQDKRSPLEASLILGLVVAGWHLPLVFLPAEDLHPVFLLSTVAITFVYTWIFNHSQGSVLMTLIAHSAQGTIAFSALGYAGADETRAVFLFTATTCLAAIGLLVFDRDAWRGRAPESCRAADKRATKDRDSIAAPTGPPRRPPVITLDAKEQQ